MDGTTDHMISTMPRDGKSTEKKQDTNTAFSNYSVTTRQSLVAEIEVSARVTKILAATTATRAGESNPAIIAALVATKETAVAVVTTTKASGKLTTKLGTITTTGAMGVTASPKTAETTTALMKIAATPIATATTTTAAATMVVAASPKAAATTTALATKTRNVAVLTATTDKAVEKQKTIIEEAALAKKQRLQ